MSLEGLSGLVNRVIAWADGLQRRHGVLGFPYAVVKKYGDDAGGRQAALVTYYGFLSIFPLLQLGVAVLSRVLADHPDLRGQLITEIVPKALRPTVEHSLASLPTSALPFVACLIGLLLSGTGVVFSAYQTLNHVAAVRHRFRAGFLSRYVRVFVVLAMRGAPRRYRMVPRQPAMAQGNAATPAASRLASLPKRRTPGRNHPGKGDAASAGLEKAAGVTVRDPRPGGAPMMPATSNPARRSRRWPRSSPFAGFELGTCPACAAEQRPEGQQDDASDRDPDTSSGQDVQGIVHPQVHPGPAHQDGVGDRHCGQRPDQERHERDDYRQGDGGVAGGKARAVRGLLAQHRIGHHFVGPRAVGNGLRYVRQHPCSADRDGSCGYRQDASISGHDVNDGEQDDGDDARRQEQMRQRRKYRGDGRRDLIENPE